MTIARRSFIAAAIVSLAASSLACSTRQSAADTSSRNLVTREELAATNARMAYEALEQLRPAWLTSRGPANMGNVRNATDAVANVFINGSRMGSLDYLKQVYVSDVHEIRFWGPGEAGARFGMGNPRGVIEIIPRR